MPNAPHVSIVAALAIIALCLPAAFALPPSGDNAAEAVENSPRHGEYMFIELPDSETNLRTWISFPETAEKAPVVIVIHEIYGLSEWITSVCDAFAEEGFIAVAPDLISGMEGAELNPRETIGRLEDAEAIRRLNVVKDFAVNLPAASGDFGVAGFCWGGKTSFLYATAQPDLSAAVVFYGTSPETSAIATIECPVLGLYGEDDNRVNSTIEPAKAEMDRLEKTYEVEIYAGAGHGFLRQQDGRDGANMEATEKAWPRTVNFLNEHTK